MSESSVRDVIARAMREHRRVKAINFGRAYACVCGEVLRSNSMQSTSEHQADVLLAVLADLPDDVIEQAADGIYDRAYGQELPEAPIDLARAAFTAVFGGEQGE